MKYIPADELIAEIERMQAENLQRFRQGLITLDTLTASDSTAFHFMDFIESLQQEQSEVEGKIVSLPVRNDIEMQADEFKKALANFKDGDKVKIIIIKSE